jgi:uncharacterized protein YyaL (SSP411 family)
MNVLALAHLTGDGAYRDRAERTLRRYGLRVGAAARVIPMMLCALSQWHAPAMQIVVVGDPTARAVQDLERELAAHYLPFALHVPVDPDSNAQSLLTRLPFVDGMQGHGGGAAYVCRDFTCKQPVSSPEALRHELQ